MTTSEPEIGPTMSYAALPALAAHPASKCSWGVFGPHDQLGTLNHLTPDRALAASKLIQKGKVFPLNWDIALPDPPLFSRGPVQRTATFGYGYADDKLDNFYLQGSTQWDSLVHASNPEHGFYNSPLRLPSGLVQGTDGGMHVWARHGIVGRFVLADVARWRNEQRRPIDPAGAESVPLSDIIGALESQDSLITHGDILLIRFGWIEWYEKANHGIRQALAANPQPRTPGLAAGPDVAEWLWDNSIAAVAADNPAVEATPTTAEPYDSLHFTLLPLLGMPLGELFVLDALAQDCAADGRYSGLFTSAPLNVVGGIGSPANALCLK